MISVGSTRFSCIILVLFGCLSFGNLVCSQEQPSEKPTQTVIAEGVGANQDEALKDAFRTAVRQVVGAVVDAETVVKNDEVIDDKVLTYSDGFIKKYDEVPGSTQVSKGLHRVKIKAEVERRSVIAKLKAANITVKEVDGKSMFADLVTKQEGESNANQIVRKAISRFPSLLTATVQGKPEYDRDKSELVLKVDVAVDQDAYQQEVIRLDEILSKVAISKDSVVLNTEPAEYFDQNRKRVRDTTGDVVVSIADIRRSPEIPRDIENAWCFWVCSTTSRKISNQKWNAYVLPGNADESLMQIALPTGLFHRKSDPKRSFYDESDNAIPKQFRYNSNRTILSIYFKDKNGVTKSEVEREISNELNYYNGSTYAQPESISINRAALLTYMHYREKNNNSLELLNPDVRQRPVTGSWITQGYLAPFAFMHVKNHDGSKDLLVSATKRTFLFRVKANPEELKSIADVTCKVEFTADPTMSK
jgi:hypothetical protein